MPTSNDMQKVLDIQDKNMIFEDNCVSYGIHKQKKGIEPGSLWLWELYSL
ncbi:hypothetical protein [Marinilactibacillus piezotolerans]|nr:hypothetical protein [Marinilactibacillus piezotolerans]